MEDTGERLIPEGNHKTLTYGEHLSRYQSVVRAVKNKVVVDVASGAGYGTNIIAKSAKFVTGVDYDKDAVAYSKKLYKAPNLKFIKANAQNLPMDDSTIDIVISLETIEHIPEPEKFIKEVKRILKPGGQFIVSTPNDDEYIEGNDFHLHEFQLKELKLLISKYFKKSTYYYQGSYFSAGVYDKKMFETGGQHAGFTFKTFGESADKAIYFIASASDDVPAILENNTVIADAWNTKDDLERDSERQKDRNKLVEELIATQKIVSDLMVKKKENEIKINSLNQDLSVMTGNRLGRVAFKVLIGLRSLYGKLLSVTRR